MEDLTIKYCTVCGEPINTVISFPTEHGRQERLVGMACKCSVERRKEAELKNQQQKIQDKIDELKKFSYMDKRLENASFSTFTVRDGNDAFLRLSKKYVENFKDFYEKSQGLMFWGPVGTGKSFAAAAIANELMALGRPVVMTSFVKMIDKVDRRKDEQYIEKLNEAELLIIDDFGAERDTDYAVEKVYDMIDSRYRSGKPLLITTNVELSHMKECEDIRYVRIYDRLFEMCYPVKFNGMSWRKKEAVARFGAMKEILER